MRRGAIIVILLAATSGCQDTLETGYKPRRLSASEAQRRSYYAPAFTPEARAASIEREQEFEARRPKPGQ